MDVPPRRSRRTLAVGVTLLAVTVAAVVAAVAAVSGAGTCSTGGLDAGFSASASDAVCYQLVRTMAERVGLATGAVTAVLTLTVVGLSRLVVPVDRPGEDAPT